MHSLLVRGAEFNFLALLLLLTHALNREFVYEAYLYVVQLCFVSTALS